MRNAGNMRGVEIIVETCHNCPFSEMIYPNNAFKCKKLNSFILLYAPIYAKCPLPELSKSEEIIYSLQKELKIEELRNEISRL